MFVGNAQRKYCYHDLARELISTTKHRLFDDEDSFSLRAYVDSITKVTTSTRCRQMSADFWSYKNSHYCHVLNTDWQSSGFAHHIEYPDQKMESVHLTIGFAVITSAKRYLLLFQLRHAKLFGKGVAISSIVEYAFFYEM